MAQGRRRPKIPRRILFFHILPRLPVCSLQRFMIVCKQWRKFLKTRMFANMHNRHLTNGSTVQLQPRFLFLSPEEPFGFRIIDFEAPDDGSIPRRHPLPFVTGEQYYILTSVHGLVCLLKYKYPDSDLILWNPLTGEYKTLCKYNPYLESYCSTEMSAGLYYNATDDDYKLLILSYHLGVHIYSLKSDSWRNVDSTDIHQTLSDFKPTRWGLSNGTWLNGNLYFLYNKKTFLYDTKKTKRGGSIIKFDTKIEKFTVIPTHPSLMDLDVKHLSMNVEKGVIYLGVKYETGRHIYSTNAYIQLWRMIGDGNWEKVGGHYRVDNCLELLHWVGNKTWLMIKKYGKDIYKVDHSKGTWIISKNITATAKYKDSYTSLMAAMLKYTESFMSLDRSI